MSIPRRTAWILVLASSAAMAQAPLRMTNSAEAIRLYEQATIDNLRERCTHIQSDTVRARAEVAALTDGLITTSEDSRRGTHRYSLLAFDKDTQLFTLIDGQQLGRDARLVLPLALPRDYAHCRIVRNAQAQEFLEVVHVARNERSSINAAHRLHDQMLRTARPAARIMPVPPGQALCTNPGRAGALRAPTQLLSDGNALALDDCPDALLYMAERTDRLLRKVFGR